MARSNSAGSHAVRPGPLWPRPGQRAFVMRHAGGLRGDLLAQWGRWKACASGALARMWLTVLLGRPFCTHGRHGTRGLGGSV